MAALEDAETLARFAKDYLAEQIEQKRGCRAFGQVTITLDFKEGLLNEVFLDEKARVRVTDLKRK